MHVLIRPVLFMTPLLIPLFGVMFGGWAWGWPAFVIIGVILFTAGLGYELFGRHAKAGVFGGLAFGALVAVSIIAALRFMNPDEDVAGVVILLFLICGLFFSAIGYIIQRYFLKR